MKLKAYMVEFNDKESNVMLVTGYSLADAYWNSQVYGYEVTGIDMIEKWEYDR